MFDKGRELGFDESIIGFRSVLFNRQQDFVGLIKIVLITDLRCEAEDHSEVEVLSKDSMSPEKSSVLSEEGGDSEVNVFEVEGGDAEKSES